MLLVVIFSWEVSTRFFRDRTEHMTDVLFGLAAFFISIPWNFQYAIPNTKRTINVLNYINTQYLGTQGVFAAILISGCAVWLYNKLMQRNFTIKLPDSVPPAVAQSFSSLIPGSITLGVFIILTGLSTACTGKTMPALFLSILQAPALAISKTNAFALVSQFTWGLLQWFGIHPTSIWGAIFGMTWAINDTQNMLGQAHHIFSTLFMNFSTIAAGTFMNPLKDTAKELTKLTKAGASNYQALRAAGLGSAELLKIDQDYGSLEVGKYADFLVLKDNPLKDVSAVEQADK